MDRPERWKAFRERIMSMGSASLSTTGLLEQMSTTKAETDYLWYSTRYICSPDKIFHLSISSLYIHTCIYIDIQFYKILCRFVYRTDFGEPILHVYSLSDVVHAFINGVYVGEEGGPNFAAPLNTYRM